MNPLISRETKNKLIEMAVERIELKIGHSGKKGNQAESRLIKVVFLNREDGFGGWVPSEHNDNMFTIVE